MATQAGREGFQYLEPANDAAPVPGLDDREVLATLEGLLRMAVWRVGHLGRSVLAGDGRPPGDKQPVRPVVLTDLFHELVESIQIRAALGQGGHAILEELGDDVHFFLDMTGQSPLGASPGVADDDGQRQRKRAQQDGDGDDPQFGSVGAHGCSYILGTIRDSMLDSIIASFEQGHSAETIQQQYPALTLEEVYGAIAWYLANPDEVSQYLERQQAVWSQWRAKAAAQPSPVAQRLRALQESEQHEPS